MAPRSVVFHGVSRKPGRLLEYLDLTSACGALQGVPYTSLDDRGNNTEKHDLNKSKCEELFEGKLEVTVVPDCFEKSDARRQNNCQYGTLQIAMKCISTIDKMVQKMDGFFRIKKKSLPIRESIAEVLHKLQQFHEDTDHVEGWTESFGNQLGRALGPPKMG